MLHWPAPKKLYSNWADINASSWKGMEELYKKDKVKSIGVCNFTKEYLLELEKTAEIMPMVNQIEYHPGVNQDELIDYCKSKNIILEAYCPLGNGKILENETLKKISFQKNKSTAQVCLRWSLQKGFVVIPKTTKKERLIENSNLFDFELTADEMSQINKIPYCGGLNINPDDFVEFG